MQHLVTGKGKDVAAGGKAKHEYTQDQRAQMAKYAAENGNAAAVRHFSKVFPGLGERLHVHVQGSLLYGKGTRKETYTGSEDFKKECMWCIYMYIHAYIIHVT